MRFPPPLLEEGHNEACPGAFLLTSGFTHVVEKNPYPWSKLGWRCRSRNSRDESGTSPVSGSRDHAACSPLGRRGVPIRAVHQSSLERATPEWTRGMDAHHEEYSEKKVRP